MQNTNNAILSNILQILLHELLKLSEKDLKDLHEGSTELTFHISKKKHKKNNDLPASKNVNHSSYQDIYNRIEKMSSREAAFEYLKKQNLSNFKLKQMAKSIDIPINKTDKNEELYEKIIEAAIGFRLRSAAIQNS
ncbi:hypothetical protein MHK_009618 [Candidatus Magnetomorum sp. HK-1]|nr:hypothetical protein MHK_009618 [Candidatus Magnetomorum sp. HK-1]